MSDQDDGRKPRLSVTLPQNQKLALEYVADAESVPGNRTTISEVARRYIREGLAREDLPQEAADLLDDDLDANAGGEAEA